MSHGGYHRQWEQLRSRWVSPRPHEVQHWGPLLLGMVVKPGTQMVGHTCSGFCEQEIRGDWATEGDVAGRWVDNRLRRSIPAIFPVQQLEHSRCTALHLQTAH